MHPKILRANFIRELRQNQLLQAKDHVLVAVSGGRDSLYAAKWLLSGELPIDLQPQVSMAYVNHQLRDDVSTEVELVDRFFKQYPEIESYQVTLEWERKPETRIEELARDRRYQALIDVAKEIGANKIITGHHQDDQIETILYKLIRGGEIDQLKGMQPSVQLTEGIALVRPFLTLSKDNMRILTKSSLEEWIEDSTNEDESFARNKIRQTILPAMKTINDQAGQHLLDLAEDILGLEQLSQSELAVKINELEFGTFNWHQSDAVMMRVLRCWLNNQGEYKIKDSYLQQGIKLMQNKNVASGEINLGSGKKLERQKNKLVYLKP